jgi:hypothetical protein
VHVSTEDVLDPIDWAIEVDETAECWETSESSEPFRRTMGPDDFRGGRFGESCWELWRLGRGGGAFVRLGSAGGGFGLSRSTGGGGSIPLDLALAG